MEKKETGTSFGFTMIELMVTISIMLFILVMAIPALRGFQARSELRGEAEIIVNSLNLARTKTIMAENDDSWGVHFFSASSTNSFVLFSSSGDGSLNATTSLSNKVELFDISLSAGKMVTFERLTGYASSTGFLSLRLVNDPTQIISVYLNSLGEVSFNPFTTPPGTFRDKDSRHVHFTYSDTVDTATQSIDLTFNGSVVETIVLDDHVVDGQIYWSDYVTVAWNLEYITLRTHRINSPDTLFSIHRDRTINNRSLDVDISGDSVISPNLVGYSADGTAVATGSSFFVGGPEWQ